MKELLINPPFHLLMGQDQSYAPLSLLWAANIAEDPGIYNFEISEDLRPLSYSERFSGFELYLSAVKNPDHLIWKNIRNVLEKYNPEEIWMTHYYAKELSIKMIASLAEEMGINVRIKKPYEKPFSKNKINASRGRFECLLQKYEKNNLSHIFTSTGCPYKCGFCLSDVKVQFREISDILSEINYLVSSFSCDLFTFWDDAFTLSKKRIKEFADKKSKSKSSNIKYVCESRADHLDEDNIKILKESGCENISVGFETGSERLLSLVRKGETLDDYYKAADFLNKHSIKWQAYAIIGFPTETREEIEETFSLMEKTKPGKIIVSVYTPYPGTFLSRTFNRDKKDIFTMCHQAKNVNLTEMGDTEYEEVILDFLKRCDDYNDRREGNV
jgi:radical SAM superfamily enzyme YgiQ (UPF0313 family)